MRVSENKEWEMRIMQKMRKFLSVILAIMMVLSVFPITVSAIDSGDWTYSVISEANKTAQITGYSGTETNLRIPTTIDGYTITSIGNKAFYKNATITQVVIPEGITSIGRYSFYWCSSLERVVIPEGVKTISYAAFMFCGNLSNIVIPASVTKIEDYAFEYCSSLKVVFFSGTKEQWKAITVGEYNTYIKSSSLNIDYECENNQLLSGSCGANAVWSLNVVTGLLTISGTGAMERATISQLPWYYYRTLVKTAVINNGITRICDYAFNDCTKLTSISIPASVESIGLNVFNSCTSLKSINVDSNNQYFSNDQYGALFDKDKTILYQYALGNGVSDYTIPDTVTKIRAEAFAESKNLKNVVIPDSVTAIYESTFEECRQLKSVVIGNGVTEIGNYAFKNCSNLEKIVFGNSLTTMGEQVFFNCDFTSIEIPSSLTKLEKRMFEDCNYLKEILIPVTITEIGWGVFYDCERLTDVYYGGSEEQWAAVVINDSYNDAIKNA
ncbi:MAG: leucine-rich repeat domain-containing protein, partial [Clostridia bacterium]|nr:leucine-rich repeat domain-containing protein [Clostridia bacterium]